MTKRLASRVNTLSPSTTLAITAKAKEMKESGIDVIGLGAGEPDYNTPDNIIEAAYRSLKEGKTKYTPAGGLPALKDAIIDKLQKRSKFKLFSTRNYGWNWCEACPVYNVPGHARSG